MDDDELSKIAYAMKKAYKEIKSRNKAVSAVAKEYPHAGAQILRSMWFAIDAYVDLNT